MSKKRIFILIIVLIVVIAVVVMLNIRLQNKSSTDGIIEIAEVKAGALSQREGKKIEIFDDNNRKIIEITQTINSKTNGIYDVTMNFHAEKCIKEIKNMTTTETIFEGNENLENWKDIEINRQGEKDTVNTYKITMANGYIVEREIKISDFFPSNNTAPSKPEIIISPEVEEIDPNTEVTITAESIDSEGDKIEYVWEGRAKEKNFYSYGEHTVRVKAVDLYGAESEWTEYTFNVREIVKPTLTFKLDVNAVEPYIVDGEEWYPYGTTVTINFANNMTGLTGKYIFEIPAELAGGETEEGEVEDEIEFDTYQTTENKTYSLELTYSRIVKASTINSNGQESAVLKKKINICCISPTTGRIRAKYRNAIGKTFVGEVTGINDASEYIYGDNYYRVSSNAGKVAVHMGLLKEGETKQLRIKIIEYTETEGCTRYGIESRDNNRDEDNCFVFVDEEGEEIIAPEFIKKVNVLEEGESIKVTVDTYSGSNIAKYYYKIDVGSFIESNNNTYTFIRTHDYNYMTVYCVDTERKRIE